MPAFWSRLVPILIPPNPREGCLLARAVIDRSQILLEKIHELEDHLSTARPLSPDLQANVARLRAIFGPSDDLVIREVELDLEPPARAVLCFIDGLIDKASANESVLKSLLETRKRAGAGGLSRLIEEQRVPVAEAREIATLQEAVQGVVAGDLLLWMEDHPRALRLNLRQPEQRKVDEPKTEVTVRGPRESFVETLRVNTSMLRRKIRNPDLIFESTVLGTVTRTRVTVAYLHGLANPKVVEEVRRRLRQVQRESQVDSILDVGYVEEFIEDAPYSPLPTVGRSERPDVVAARLLEGRVAVLVDGSPTALTVPSLFVEHLISSEDYYLRSYFSSLTRLLRVVAFLATLLLPAVTAALVTFHREMIPTKLLVALASSKEGTPFPMVAELVLLGLFFEIVREAGIRMPRPLGQAISIVGTLLLGDAAIRAGLTSTITVIVTALTGLSLLALPSYEMAVALIPLRLLLVGAASFLGLYGLSLALIAMALHLVSLRSFGAPYMSPLAPLTPADFKDLFIRAPWWAMKRRPRVVGWPEPRRQKILPRPY